MKTFKFMHSPFVKVALLVCATSAVAGCGSTLTDDPKRHDPRLQHPIQVAREQVSVTIDLPAEGVALSPEDSRRLQTFIRDFAERGRTAVTVESQMADRARQVLEAQGLRANEIVLMPDTTLNAPSAMMTFTANVAQVPTCGDWSENYAFNPTNNPTADFGCSTRRNLGLTVADPGDLIDAQPMSGRGAARQDTVLDSYNAGTPIGPQAAPINTQSVSGVAK
ncbi:MAG: CpaD family pilus assembly protein [Rhodospirillales bacterium]|nr:CpaD family pilus assembly protein [Rhodospirillales bacterium]